MSDAYTFYATSLDVAGVAAVILSQSYGAKDVETNEKTPILFGWNEWLDERGINDAWIESHYAELADVFDSFAIGSVEARKDFDRAMELIDDPAKREQFRNERQERQRSSVSQIGERAYAIAKAFRAKLQGGDA
jgi:hypothetical protein